MKKGYTIENIDCLTDVTLKAIVVFNYPNLNEIVSHFVSYYPTKENTSMKNLIGVWKIKN